MLNIFNLLVAYFEELANKSVHINSSYRWNAQEVKEKIRSGITPTIMLIDSPTIEEQGQDAPSQSDHCHCALTFLGKPGVYTNRIDCFEEQNQVLNHCLNIAMLFRAKIKQDAETAFLPNGEKNFLYGRVAYASFKFYKVGNVFTDNLYGYRLEFEVLQKPITTVNPTDWSQ